MIPPYARRYVDRRRFVEKEGEDLLPETLALVDTLGWRVADSAIVGLPSTAKYVYNYLVYRSSVGT